MQKLSVLLMTLYWKVLRGKGVEKTAAEKEKEAKILSGRECNKKIREEKRLEREYKK